MSSPTDLPSHVRAIVDEIETEIGEEPAGRSARHRGRGRARRQRPRGGRRPPDPARDRRGPRPPGPASGTPERVHRMYTELTAGYHVDPGAADQRRDLRRRLQRDGRRQGHPVLLALRAPPAAVLRDRRRRLHPARPGHRALEDPAHRRDVRPPPPGPGAADPADRRVPPGATSRRRASASSWRRPTCARSCAACASPGRS